MNRFGVARLIALSCALLALGQACAEVTRIEVLSSTPFGKFHRGDFIKRELRIYGELSPEAESVRELDKAQRNDKGKVEYTTVVTLVMPADPAVANGTLIVDIPNRGRPTLQALFNSPRQVAMPLGSPAPGNGFLEEQGFTTAAIFWELSKDVQLPHTAANDSDGGKPLYIEAAALPMVRDVSEAVRMYDIAGGSHALIAAKSQCSLPYGRLDWHPVLRATLLMLERWVAKNEAPPPNVLMPLKDAAGDPLVLQAPRHLQQATIKVPVRDSDGNPVGGIRLPDVDVPLGANAVQNPPLNFLCSLGAGFSGFSKTTLDARYKGRDDYVAKVRASAAALEQRGFLLPQDAAEIIDAASSTHLAGPN